MMKHNFQNQNSRNSDNPLIFITQSPSPPLSSPSWSPSSSLLNITGDIQSDSNQNQNIDHHESDLMIGRDGHFDHQHYPNHLDHHLDCPNHLNHLDHSNHLDHDHHMSPPLLTLNPPNNDHHHQQQPEHQQSSIKKNNFHCFCICHHEICTCLLLSLIVIGLPLTIVIMLINLPRLSNHYDQRQQNYLLLAFGLPFSSVLLVAFCYSVYNLIKRLRKNNDNNQLSLLNKLKRFDVDHHHQNDSIKFKKSSTIGSIDNGDIDDVDDDDEPKLYTLVTQVMTNHRLSVCQNQNDDSNQNYDQ